MIVRLIVSVLLILGGIIAAVYSQMRASALRRISVAESAEEYRRLTRAVVLWTVLCCTIPMGLAPPWNGEDPGHRNQYELITESFLNGHLYFDYEVDEKLLELENPYDPQAREEVGASFHWDHAFYHGHYYMYFGVVPVFLLFLPYRVITGTALTSYHATQVFTAVFILGLFSLFRLLAERFFRRLSMSAYLLLGAALSMMSVWYAVAAPALYCTAITGALCLSVWSVYCFVKAVFCTENENRAIGLAACGALLGALEFGCRPTVGLSNLLVIPLLAAFLRKRKLSLKLAGKLLCAALPYAAVAAGLMYYNYLRFDDPFEFGQAYQLTVADQSGYGNMISNIDAKQLFAGIRYYLFNVFIPHNLTDTVSFGAFITFPIIVYALWVGMKRSTFTRIREAGIASWIWSLPVSILVILLFQIAWTPVPASRYRMDFNYLLAILSYVLLGFSYETAREKERLSLRIGNLALLTALVSIALALVPHDTNFTQCYQESIKEAWHFVFS